MLINWTIIIERKFKNSRKHCQYKQVVIQTTAAIKSIPGLLA